MPPSSFLLRNQLKLTPSSLTTTMSLSIQNPKKLLFLSKSPNYSFPQHHHRRSFKSLIVFSNTKNFSSSSAIHSINSIEFELQRSQRGLVLSRRLTPFPSFQQLQQRFPYGRYAYDDYSEEESDHDVQSSSSSKNNSSTFDNIEEWKWKLTMLTRNKNEEEVVSKEKKDRRDFLHLEALASRMGLYSRQYSKVVVFSKAPLPNYRSDLDDKRPQREYNRELYAALGKDESLSKKCWILQMSSLT